MMMRGEPFSRAKWAAYSVATHHDWLKADETRQRLKRTVAGFFEKWHAIIMPVAPSTAFEHIETGDAVTRLLKVDGQPTPYHSFHSWIALASVAHLPAAAVPVPRRAGELPCGVQVVGPEGSDAEVLAIAEALEAGMGGFRRPPEDGLTAPLELFERTAKRPSKPKAKTRPQKPAKKAKPRKPKR
jgi:amidase